MKGLVPEGQLTTPLYDLWIREITRALRAPANPRPAETIEARPPEMAALAVFRAPLDHAAASSDPLHWPLPHNNTRNQRTWRLSQSDSNGRGAGCDQQNRPQM